MVCSLAFCGGGSSGPAGAGWRWPRVLPLPHGSARGHLSAPAVPGSLRQRARPLSAPAVPGSLRRRARLSTTHPRRCPLHSGRLLRYSRSVVRCPSARACARGASGRSVVGRRSSLGARFAPASPRLRPGAPLRGRCAPSLRPSSLLPPSLQLACSALPVGSALPLSFRFTPSLHFATSRVSTPFRAAHCCLRSPGAASAPSRRALLPPGARHPSPPATASHRPPAAARTRPDPLDVCRLSPPRTAADPWTRPSAPAEPPPDRRR